jgi:hypothetical protein
MAIRIKVIPDIASLKEMISCYCMSKQPALTRGKHINDHPNLHIDKLNNFYRGILKEFLVLNFIDFLLKYLLSFFGYPIRIIVAYMNIFEVFKIMTFNQIIT